MLALAVLWFGLPWLVGKTLESRLSDELARRSVPGLVQLEDMQIDRGWRQSRLTGRAVLVGALCPGQPCPALPIVAQIDHGPILPGDDATPWHLGLAAARAEIDPAPLARRLAIGPAAPLWLRTRIDWQGQGRLAFHLGAIEGKPQGPDGRDGRLESAPIEGSATLRDYGRRLGPWQFDWPGLAWIGPQAGRISWRHLHVAQQQMASGQRYIGSADSLTLDTGRGLATRLVGIEAERTVNGRARAIWLTADRMLLPDNTQAWLAWRAQSRHLPPDRLLNFIREWRAAGGLAGGVLGQTRLYSEMLPRLLADEARWQSELQLSTARDRLDLSIDVAAPSDFDAPPSAEAFIAALDGELNVTLTADWLSALLARLDPPTPEPDVSGSDLSTARSDDRADTGPVATDDPAERDSPANPADASEASGSAESTSATRIASLVERELIVPIEPGARYRLQARWAQGRVWINGRPRPEWRAIVQQLQSAALDLTSESRPPDTP